MQLVIDITGTVGDQALPPGLREDVVANVQTMVDNLRGVCHARGGTVAFEITDASVTLGEQVTALTLPTPIVVG